LETVGGAVVLAFVVSGFLSWWERYPINNTMVIFLGVFLCFMTVAFYRQKAGKKTRAQEVIAEVKELPTSPNTATLYA
jgi:positive regulator of sigma E activity